MAPKPAISGSREERRQRALVTGASTGIGAELARAFARRGFDLVLLARDRAKLERLAQELESALPVRVAVLAADLSDPGAPRRIAEELTREGRDIDILVNNAGVICEGDFLDLALEDELRLLQINVVALTALTHLFAGPMKARGAGRILNVASIAAFAPAPRIAVYAAAKAYVLSFTEALSEELAGSGVTATALCPGFTDTPMLTRSVVGRGLPRSVVMTARAVAEQGCAACLAGETVCTPGLVNSATTLGAQLLPRAMVRSLGGLARKLSLRAPATKPAQGDAQRSAREQDPYPSTRLVAANGIDLAISETGAPGDPAILLIMGLGMQLIAWPDEFCAGLAARGFRVIRFDNRDVGESTKFRSKRAAATAAAIAGALAGRAVAPPYSLADMAQDAIALMDALGVARAHVVGASMGGMIGQIMAAEYPARVASFVSIMSSSGDPTLPRPAPKIQRALLRPRPRLSRERAIRQTMRILRLIGSPEYPMGDAELRAKVERSVERCYYPAGVSRHLAAVLASGSRVKLLSRISAPTLVVHGAADPLVPLAAGQDTAAHIAGARLLVAPGMGHDLPAQLTPMLVDEIADHCAAAENSFTSGDARRRRGNRS